MWRLAFRPNSSILVSSDQRILFLMVWESLGAFWKTSSGLSCAFYWIVAPVWPLPWRPDWWRATEIRVPLWRWDKLPEGQQRSVRVTIRFLVTSLTKALLPQLLSLAGRPALGRALVVLNFFHLRMMCSLCSWGPSMLQTFFGTLPQMCLDKTCLWALRRIPLTSWLGFCSDMHCQLWDLI